MGFPPLVQPLPSHLCQNQTASDSEIPALAQYSLTSSSVGGAKRALLPEGAGDDACEGEGEGEGEGLSFRNASVIVPLCSPLLRLDNGVITVLSLRFHRLAIPRLPASLFWSLLASAADNSRSHLSCDHSPPVLLESSAAVPRHRP